ncbi:MAG: type I 3-dehydroquinate dehydratase [Candidatus Ventricola sp.]
MRELQKTVRLGRVTLGEGMPKICVPVMGQDAQTIRAAAMRAARAQADLIELRADSLGQAPDAACVIDACRAARDAGLPLILTMRTRRDGGAGSDDAAMYEALLCAVARAGVCEAIDCELSAGEACFARVVRASHEAGIPVIGSSHEFGEIGDMRRAADWLLRQEALGADVCKAAVMTRTGAQALEAALVMARAGERMRTPIIAIAMGPAGVLTRVGGAFIGSCLTFGTAGEASAPGQMDAQALRLVMESLQQAR